MASDIQITSLTAVGGVGSIALLAEWAAPAIQSSLPYMQTASVVFYVSATNDFNTATVAGESVTGVISIGSLPLSATRYIWARAKDPAGNLGPRYPTAGGVSVTTASTNPGPNSVGPGELQDSAVTEQKIANLAVTNAKIANIAADKITAGTINATIAINGPTITGGLVRTSSGSNRVELSGPSNELAVYQSGSFIARLGPSFGSGVLVVNSGSAQAGTLTANFGNSTLGAFQVGNSANGVAGYFRNLSSGSFAHGLRGQAGGSGLVGVSNTSGGYAFFAEIGSYGPFTGAHDAFLPINQEVEIGEIVCSSDLVLATKGVDDALLVVEVSSKEKQRGAYGIVAQSGPFDPYSSIAGLPPVPEGEAPDHLREWMAKTYQRLSVNGCGEGLVLVCGRGGDIEVGDYICTSSMRGKGQRQNDTDGNADDLLRRHTVAQATQSIKFSDPDEVQLVACIYKCG